MDITIQPGKLSGTVRAIPSKSQAHRLLICAAFADGPTELYCSQVNRDIEATADCLNALCGSVRRTDYGYAISPYAPGSSDHAITLNCRDSGSTLRFLLPVAGALGKEVIFKMEGRLPQRPLSPLWEEMERMGCRLRRISSDELLVRGKLRPGDYCIDGNVSSQFISGLLFAAPLLDGHTAIHVKGKLESAPYVEMTQKAMTLFGIDTAGLRIPAGQKFHSPGKITVEGDWSNSAFWLGATALGSDLKVTNLDQKSPQGDRKVAELLPILSRNTSISVSDIPDLVPILAVVASANAGAVFTDIARLRLKESDRVASTVAMIRALGGEAEATDETLTVHGTGLTGGTVDSCNDHRIAMSAAIASTVCSGPVSILGTQCVEKSYPRFWDEFKLLGGKYELNLR
ncbi:MAG: 3-phosphoshikimate 1-carboxyvinyltransferase [Ruminococcaceae bacterium]|nr:3-phosphoshikimate 1-carboxyvinyltransferase [Oscillospiraceae bacterium]